MICIHLVPLEKRCFQCRPGIDVPVPIAYVRAFDEMLTLLGMLETTGALNRDERALVARTRAARGER